MDRQTTQATSAEKTEPRRRQRVGRALVVAAALSALMVTSAATASAASVSGVAGRFTAANCGWYLQPGPLLGFVDYKVSLVNLPAVTGTTTAAQLVWVYVQFAHPATTGWVAYRGGWLYTYARAGVWTTSWTDYNTGVSGKTKMSDVAPESGYTGAEFISLDTAVYMSMSWMTGSTTTGSASEWAVAPRNTNNSMVCNGLG